MTKIKIIETKSKRHASALATDNFLQRPEFVKAITLQLKCEIIKNTAEI